ncbi:DUF3310 domain-containing protein [Kribbella sp. NPDC051718]|uniref:DUF3310 domain-containing protein n=1 Tax=Kribbella sp. NPDC051718 TaxID=3155168 RepID=UPI003425A292
MSPTDPNEAVNHPAHYGGDTTYEAIKVIEAWGLGFTLGNAVKYICRAGAKGRRIEDLRKAAWYLQHEIERLEAGQVAACDNCGWVGGIAKVVDGKCPANCTLPLRYCAGVS